MPEIKYEAPKLTRYGKPSEFIEAGSVAIATGDVTGDNEADTLFDTDGDGLGNFVVGGASGGITPVTSQILMTSGSPPGYDADGDGLAGIADFGGNLFAIPQSAIGSGNTDLESASDDGWDDPARD